IAARGGREVVDEDVDPLGDVPRARLRLKDRRRDRADPRRKPGIVQVPDLERALAARYAQLEGDEVDVRLSWGGEGDLDRGGLARLGRGTTGRRNGDAAGEEDGDEKKKAAADGSTLVQPVDGAED